MLLWAAFWLLALRLGTVTCIGEIIYALNAGGESFTDSHGIRYRRDYLTTGTASDYGRMVDIKRMNPADKPLYETERYATETFGYTIPIPAGDADYVLWLKFSEVWFNAPGLKVFDVALNDVVVVSELDIFDKVGRGVAHDEVVAFQIRQKKIIIEGKSYPFSNEIQVEFIKTSRDNPKINAIIIMKGVPSQVPALPPYERDLSEQPLGEYDEDDSPPHRRELDDEEFEEDEDDEAGEEAERAKLNRLRREQQNSMRGAGESQDESAASRKKQKSSSAAKQLPTVEIDNPYESDETSYIVPILVALGAFIPLLFCLCKL